MSGNNISDDSEEASAITALTFPSRLILEPKSKKQTNNIKINSSLILFTTSMLKDKNKILSIQQNNKNDAKTYFMTAHFLPLPSFPNPPVQTDFRTIVIQKTPCFVKNNKPGDNFRKKHEITQSNREKTEKTEKPGIEYQADITFLTPTKIKPVKICIFETNF